MFIDIYTKNCEEAGVAPTGVLSALGISKSAYSNWKKGGEPSNRTKKQIADYFGISVPELMSGKINAAPIRSGQGQFFALCARLIFAVQLAPVFKAPQHYSIVPDDPAKVQAGGAALT